MITRVRNWLPGILAFVAIAINAGLIWQASKCFGAISDLPEYYGAARLVITGCGAQVYDLLALSKIENQCFPELAGRAIGLMLPPVAIPLLVPLGFCPVDLVPVIWKIVNIAALLFSLYLLKRIFVLDTCAFLWLTAWFALAGPVYEALRIDQLAPILLFAFSLALWACKYGHPYIAGVALALLGIKPQQAWPFLLLLLAQRRLAPLLTASVTSFVFTLTAFLLLGVSGVVKYVMVFSSIAQPFMQPELGATVRGQLLRIFPQASELVMLVSMFVLIAASAAIFFAAKEFAGSKYALEIGTLLAMPLGLVTSLHCHDYDLILLLPSMIVLVKYFDKFKQGRWLYFVFAAILFSFMLPVYAEVHYNWLLKGAIVNPYFLALLILSLGSFYIVYLNREEFQP